MRNMLKNASIINKKVITYVNNVIRNIYRIRSNDIKWFGTDFDAATAKLRKDSATIKSNWGLARLSSMGIINGVELGRLELYESYLKNSKQRKTTITKRHYIFNSRIIGNAVGGAGSNLYVVTNKEKSSTTIVEAPKGYDGNTSFVQVLAPVAITDSKGTGSSTALVDFYTVVDSFLSRVENKDALLYYSNKVTQGNFSINIAKRKESVIVNVDATGLSDDTFEDGSIPYFIIKVDFYRRGYD